MIKFTINPRAQPVVYSFDKNVVTIGGGKKDEADLTLSGEKLEAVHVKIMEQGTRFIAINVANDPFVTINGIPFGKKIIATNDILEIGDTELIFEGWPTPVMQDHGVTDTAVGLTPILDKVITQREEEVARAASNVHHNPSFETSLHQTSGEKEEFDLEKEMRQLDEWLQATSHLAPEEIESKEQPVEGSKEPIIQELDAFLQEAQAAAQTAFTPLDTAPQKPVHKQTIKDLYFKDFEEDCQPRKDPTDANQPTSAIGMDWHTISIIVVGVISTIIIVALLLYANASGKSEDDELRAAEGVADVAMALAYAQFNSIVPQNQNWSDPEFLKNNLTAVLSSEYPSLAQLDSHGQFTNSAYLLRIYTSSDLSNFLVIAQPAPSLLHWLIPKSTILVYSKEMELRRTKDLRALNRILINPSLDGYVANDVANIVKKAEIIPLSSLSKRQHRLGFSPPKALALIRPDAENRIYNAPRYYNFGESIMKKAVALAENQENNNEILLLKKEIESLQHYSNFVMYSSQGIQAALQAQKALALFEPSANFLIAYLQYNNHGTVHSSHLLIDNGSTDVVFNENSDRKKYSEQLTPPTTSQAEGRSDHSLVTQTDLTHPLFFQLSALAASRQQILKPLSHEIMALMESENQYAIPDFRSQFHDAAQKYLTAIDEQQTRIIKGIKQLYQQYPAMPLTEFMHYVKTADLGNLAKESLKEQISKVSSGEVAAETITQQIQVIKQSANFVQLEDALAQANRLFTLENIPNTEQIIALQNTVKAETLAKIDAFILSPKDQLPGNTFTEDNRLRLLNILKSAWVRNQEEIDYYLSEFSLLQNTGMPDPTPLPEVAAPISSTFKEHNRFWQQGRVWKKGATK